MKHKHIGFLIILTVFVLCSCSQPVGSISNEDKGGEVIFYIIAIRDEIYLKNQIEDQKRFYRRKDCLKVFGADINDSELNLKIVNDPLSVQTPPVDYNLNVSGFFEFTQPGQYILRGDYKGKQDEYPIIVYDKDPGSDDPSSGIIWEWLN